MARPAAYERARLVTEKKSVRTTIEGVMAVREREFRMLDWSRHGALPVGFESFPAFFLTSDSPPCGVISGLAGREQVQVVVYLLSPASQGFLGRALALQGAVHGAGERHAAIEHLNVDVLVVQQGRPVVMTAQALFQQVVGSGGAERGNSEAGRPWGRLGLKMLFAVRQHLHPVLHLHYPMDARGQLQGPLLLEVRGHNAVQERALELAAGIH